MIAINKTDDDVRDFQLLDILPYNGDNRGSKFSGSYRVSKIEVEEINSLTGNKVFDNDKIVEYVKNNYSQEKINKDIANLFSKCIANFNS